MYRYMHAFVLFFGEQGCFMKRPTLDPEGNQSS